MNDIVINKIQNIQRCVRRAREEYAADRDGFATNYTRQDAALLNELLAQHDIEGLVFGDFEITDLEQSDDGYWLKGIARGEPMDIERHQPKTEVKAATYGGLEYVVDEKGQHVLQCVLDL